MNTVVNLFKTTSSFHLALRLFSSVLLSQYTLITIISWATKGAVALCRTFIKSFCLHVPALIMDHLFVKGIFNHFHVHFVELDSLCIILVIVVLTISHSVSHRANRYIALTFLYGIKV